MVVDSIDLLEWCKFILEIEFGADLTNKSKHGCLGGSDSGFVLPFLSH